MPDELKPPKLFYIQNALHPEKFEIYCAGEIRPATKEECVDLECCAVWEPEQVVERINNFYAGVPYKWINRPF